MSKNKIVFFVILILSVGIAGTILFLNSSKDNPQNNLGRTETREVKDKSKITLNIISKTGSSDDFFQKARNLFVEKNPEINIEFKGMGTFEAVDYISKDNDIDAWLSADETGANMLEGNYVKEHNGKSIVLDAEPIVASPLVIVGWEERLNVLGEISISKLYDIVSKGKTWESVGGKTEWGFVNFSHTDAIESNSGMQFITLLIHDFYNQNKASKKDLKVEDIANDKLVEYVRSFEKNTAKQEEGSGKFIDSMILFGPSRYDMGAIYEYYALTNAKNAVGRWGNLKIIYPSPTIWSNKPFVILNGKNSTKEKIDACKKFKEFLLSTDIQQSAMTEGYRPASKSISDISYLEKEFGKYGFKKDIPSAVSTPDIQVIENIQAMVKRIK